MYDSLHDSNYLDLKLDSRGLFKAYEIIKCSRGADISDYIGKLQESSFTKN
jgi:hypothetical protein